VLHHRHSLKTARSHHFTWSPLARCLLPPYLGWPPPAMGKADTMFLACYAPTKASSSTSVPWILKKASNTLKLRHDFPIMPRFFCPATFAKVRYTKGRIMASEVSPRIFEGCCGRVHAPGLQAVDAPCISSKPNRSSSNIKSCSQNSFYA
jgi:hypothetical protein